MFRFIKAEYHHLVLSDKRSFPYILDNLIPKEYIFDFPRTRMWFHGVIGFQNDAWNRLGRKTETLMRLRVAFVYFNVLYFWTWNFHDTRLTFRVSRVSLWLQYVFEFKLQMLCTDCSCQGFTFLLMPFRNIQLHFNTDFKHLRIETSIAAWIRHFSVQVWKKT